LLLLLLLLLQMLCWVCGCKEGRRGGTGWRAKAACFCPVFSANEEIDSNVRCRGIDKPIISPYVSPEAEQETEWIILGAHETESICRLNCLHAIRSLEEGDERRMNVESDEPPTATVWVYAGLTLSKINKKTSFSFFFQNEEVVMFMFWFI
jgi:hypothetical protein